MLELLNNRPFDNERNILNADLFVNNLKHTLRGFKFNTKINYEVYRNITIYTITWNDDKTYEDILELKKEIAVSLGINTIDLHIEKITDQQVRIKVLNMKQSTLTLRELLEEAKDNKNIFNNGLSLCSNIINIPTTKAISVDIGMPIPSENGVPKLIIVNIIAGNKTPPIAAIIGNEAFLKLDNLPYNISCFISRPTNKKNIAIKKSFIIR